MTLPRASCSTLLNVATIVLTLVSSKLISTNDMVASFGDQFLGLSSKNCGPWNQWSKSKWAKDMERVEISAGFDEDGIWIEMSGDKFAWMTFFLFWTKYDNVFNLFYPPQSHHAITPTKYAWYCNHLANDI